MVFNEFDINTNINPNSELHKYLELADEELEVAQLLFNTCFYRDSIIHSYLVMNFLIKDLMHWKGFEIDDLDEIILLFNHVMVVGEKFPKGIIDPMIKAQPTVHKVVHDKKYETNKTEAETLLNDAKKFFKETITFFKTHS